MGKFTNINKLSKKEQDELFIRFVQSIAALRNPTEAANLVKDMLSEQEALMFARRLQIADLLSQGLTYGQIRKEMKVSPATIAKVQTWMKLYGDGYRMVLSRTQRSTKNSGPLAPWRKLKHKYPTYFWPELLLREIVRSASNREKQRLIKVVDDLRGKTKLAKELERILRPQKY